MLSSSKNSARCLLIFSLLLTPFGVVAAEKGVKITVRTISTTGKPVWARVFKRGDGASDWAPLPGKPNGEGKWEFVDAKCDFTIKFKAEPAYSSYSRNTDVILPCAKPEVVFNDFVPTEFAAVYEALGSRDLAVWGRALGGEMDGFSQEFVDKFADAIESQQYGAIAVIGTELAAQMRGAGNYNGAMLFSSVAVDASARGVYEKAGVPLGIDMPVIYMKGGTTLLLTQAGKDQLVKYQIEALGLPKKAAGKLDWATMRSLPGGEVGSPGTELEFAL